MLVLILNIMLNILAPNQNNFQQEVGKYIDQQFQAYDSLSYSIEDDLSNYTNLEINYQRRPNKIGNKFYIPIRYTDQYNIEKEKFIDAKILLFQKVVVSKTKIKKGTEISPANCKVEMRDITENNFTPLIKIKPGFVAKYNILPNNVISKEVLNRAPILDVGDRVTARLDYGSVSISFQAMVRQSGAEGDLIKVKANNSQYTAKVVNKNTVTIVE